jgi:hypothetical protein
VKDVLHDDRVSARWQFFEEIAAFDPHSASNSGAIECRNGTRGNVGEIEQHATHPLVATKDSGQQQSMPARDVHQRIDASSIALIDVMALSKTAATSGFREKCSNMGSLKT